MEVDIEREHRVERKKKPEAAKKIGTAQDHCLSPEEQVNFMRNVLRIVFPIDFTANKNNLQSSHAN